MRGVCFPSGSQSEVVRLPYSAALQVLFKRLMMQGSPEVEGLPLSEFPQRVTAIHSTQETAEQCPSYVRS